MPLLSGQSVFCPSCVYTMVLFVYSVFYCTDDNRDLHSFPTRRSSDLRLYVRADGGEPPGAHHIRQGEQAREQLGRSEEHTSELQSRLHLVCRLLLEKKKVSLPINYLIQQKATKHHASKPNQYRLTHKY